MNEHKKTQVSFYAYDEIIEEIKKEAENSLMSFSNYLIMLHKLNIQNKGAIKNG